VRLLLWRHGRTTWNDVGRFQGHADPPLDETGRAQVAAVAPLISGLRPDAVVSSDLERCRQTAAGLKLPFRTDPRLREIDLGLWSGLTGAEAAARFPEEDRAWRSGVDVPRGGGETYLDVARRAGEVFDEVRAELASPDPDRLVVFVLHGGTARALIGRVLGIRRSCGGTSGRWRTAAGPCCAWPRAGSGSPSTTRGRCWLVRSAVPDRVSPRPSCPVRGLRRSPIRNLYTCRSSPPGTEVQVREGNTPRSPRI